MRQLRGPEQSSHRDRGHVNAEMAAGGARTDPVQDDTGLGEPPHSPGARAGFDTREASEYGAPSCILACYGHRRD
ncbi:hypothetical protein KUCAC02_025848 [Chaenocephalus aceratus]|uniref:Uncharacterized protein n=1 Tax=Chaenocephalus aceratus TaxID=36190 RepID=A0ACB9VV65_CHAAC|nr:hypothetical protein KUCAC02_025848 [Chaenocephalus aceratus]